MDDILNDLIKTDNEERSKEDIVNKSVEPDKSQLDPNIEKTTSDFDKDKDVNNDNLSKDPKVVDPVAKDSDPEKVEPKVPEKKKYSKQEQTNYAFAKLKERKNREISRLQREIDDLKKNQSTVKGKESFATPEDYQSYLVEKGVTSHLISDKEQQIKNHTQDLEMEQAEDEGAKRVIECFPDEKEREEYFDRYEDAQVKKTWKLADGKTITASILDIITQSDPAIKNKNLTVVDHILNSPKGPRVLDYFLQNLGKLGEVMSMPDPLDQKLYLRDIEKTFKNNNSTAGLTAVELNSKWKFKSHKKIETKNSPLIKEVPKLGSQASRKIPNKIGSSDNLLNMLQYVRSVR
jgi:hypothetical protein